MVLANWGVRQPGVELIWFSRIGVRRHGRDVEAGDSRTGPTLPDIPSGFRQYRLGPAPAGGGPSRPNGVLNVRAEDNQAAGQRHEAEQDSNHQAHPEVDIADGGLKTQVGAWHDYGSSPSGLVSDYARGRRLIFERSGDGEEVDPEGRASARRTGDMNPGMVGFHDPACDG